MKITTAPQTLPLTGKAVAAKIKDMNLPIDIEESYLAAVQERPSVSLGEMRSLVAAYDRAGVDAVNQSLIERASSERPFLY